MPHFLTDVLAAWEKYRDRPLFKQLVQGAEGQKTWIPITYEDFQNETDRVGRHWRATLSSQGFKSSDVIGLWATGQKYTDLIHIYSLIRAGFIPQLFSVTYQSGEVVRDLLIACNGKALLYDPAFAVAVEGHVDLPAICLPAVDTLQSSSDPLPPLLDVAEDEPAMILHTSGTTSGKPKPVPVTHRNLKGQQSQFRGINQGAFETQDIYNKLGSYCHIGTASSISYMSLRGDCTVQTSRSDFDAEEFLQLTREAGVNRLFLYAPWLSNLLKFARTNQDVLDTLKNMRQIIYTGASLNPEDEAWMVAQNIPGTLLYATTEAFLILISDLNERQDLPAMRLIPGVECEFIPNDNSEPDKGTLYDVFLPAHSSNCPHPSFRNRENGHYTGDLFEQVKPGRYIFRGRNDDWIRTGPSLSFCDTKAIEDNVLQVSSQLVSNCTAVGHYKPGVVLFVEPVTPVTPGSDKEMVLKKEIIALTAPFNARLFLHERITDPGRIVVVPQGKLARTKEKGNIRRKAVEDEFSDILQEIYRIV
ncbi:acetyl-CoA synthetase-like protein [Roridomyces roridus]|uniref:Acetyl-CoA synthetase-like protein n=1 Tax=Roridomyces roridus TaxID=1738132 RepID=A0AAD7B6Q8_9AGAR|nr:acetyl-CoA synthetase-like protein [Roridomyces roridus]